jgi:hypothetical protein
MVRDGSWGWLKGSFAVNIAALILIVIGTAGAGRLSLPVSPDPFARVLGWRDVAAATRDELAKARAAGRPFAAVVADSREAMAELLYYMRGEPTPLLALRRGGRPRDHFELVRPYTPATGAPVLLVRLDRGPSAALSDFDVAEKIGERQLPAGPQTMRHVTFYALSGYKGQ